MSFWQTTLNRLGIGSPSLKGVESGRVPVAPRVGGSGITHTALGTSFPFWGQNVDGYDSVLNSGAFDYEGEISRYDDNSIVAACLAWMISSFSNVRLQVGKRDGETFTPLQKPHKVLELLHKPSGNYSGTWLFATLFTDFWDQGNHYWNIVRGGGKKGDPVEIQALPAALTAPYKAQEDPFKTFDCYRYRYMGGTRDIDPEQVVHFRYWIPDMADNRKGRRPLTAVRREVYADNKASEVAAAMLRKPRPSGILMPDGEAEVLEDHLRHIKQAASEATSAENAGSILALGGGTKFVQLSFSPKDLALDEARRKPEERVCAVFQLPPVVVGIGAGLDRSTYNNMQEARKAAWQDCMVPFLNYIAQVISERLLPMYAGSEGLVAEWDYSAVGVLQPDVTADRTSAREDYKLGLITREEARTEGGRTALPEVGDFSAIPEPSPVALPPASGKSFKPSFKVAGSEPVGSLYAAAERYRRALAADEVEALNRLAKEWERTQRRIDNDTEALLAYLSAASAENVPASEWRVEALARLEAIRGQIGDELADLADRGAVVVEGAQRSAVASALANTEAVARAAAGPVPAGVSLSWRSLPSEAFEAFIGFASNDSPLSKLLSEFAGEEPENIFRAVAEGIARGDNPRAVAARLTGAVSSSRARLETICRTEMLRAAREATRRTYMENADIVRGYRRLSAADSRTCIACWALHGSLTPLAEVMPTHPNCRCVAVPEIRSWAEITGDANLPDTREPMLSGEELFAGLSPQVQAEVLGPARFELYQNGTPLSKMSGAGVDPEWGPTTRVKPLDEVML